MYPSQAPVANISLFPNLISETESIKLSFVILGVYVDENMNTYIGCIINLINCT